MLSRSKIVSVLFGLGSFFGLNPLSAGPETPSSATRPNVILVLVDDLSANELALYGHPTHRTPRIDALARTGVHFATTYATPICHPSRYALLTGQYPHHSGVFHFSHREGGPPVEHHGADDIASHLTLGKVFQQAGYKTALAGKWQMSGEVPTLIHEAGFDHYRIWAYDENLPAGVTHEGGRERTEIARTSRYWHPSIMEDGAYLPTKPHDYGPDLFADFLIDFMRQQTQAAPDGRPFFAYYPMALTHEPYYPTPDSWQPGQDKFTPSPDNWSANVAYTDKIVGRLLDAVDELNIADHTIIVFTSDNGTALNGKGFTTEAGVRVPLVIRGPGIAAHPERSNALSDLTDLFPTLCDLTGVPRPKGHHLDGQSLAPYLRGTGEATRTWAYGPVGGRRTLRTERWLLENNTPWNFGQLYDCGDRRDGEGYLDVTNSQAPEVMAARRQLRAILADLPVPEVARNDPRLLPRTQPFHLMPDERTDLNSPAIIDLWPEGVPGQLPNPPAMATDGNRYWSVHSPTITVFPAPDPLPGAPLMLVIPGGGYHRNGWLNGGMRPARWLNELGITAAVLKYRLSEYDYPAQLQDAQRALRLLRHRAADFGGTPDNIGVIGGSAGGHLAAHLSTAWKLDTGLPADPLAHVSARPDFQILLYPVISGDPAIAHAGSIKALVGENPSPAQLAAVSIETLVTAETPPAFIVTTADDTVVPFANSVTFFQALQSAGVPADLHVFQTGPHGFSTQALALPVAAWTKLAATWMTHRNVLPSRSSSSH